MVNVYFDSLKREILMYSRYFEGKSVVTIYFGGGTPSHVPVKLVEGVVETLAQNVFLNVEEATFEFNPEDVNRQLCRDLRELGINRVSVGLQTSSDELLKVLGRPYTFKDFERAYSLLRETFDNVNVDFMYSLPFEKLSDVENDLKVVEDLNPDHVSFYELEVHEGVPLFSMVRAGQVQLPVEDVSESMYDLVVEILGDLGYERYELSSWTKKKPCIHNLRYWKNEDYIGLGLSAGSHVSNERWVNTSEIREYVSQLAAEKYPRAYSSVNDPSIEVAETLFMGLRLAEGLNIAEMREKFGDDFDRVFAKIEKFCGELLECSDRLKFTKTGMKFSAMVLREIT